jgi:hypothetical protein
MPEFKSKSKLCYDRRSAGLFVLVSSRIWGPGPDFSYCLTVAGLLMWGALSDERMVLSITIAAGPSQRSHIFRSRNHALYIYNFTYGYSTLSFVKESGSLWTTAIYNFTCNFIYYCQTVAGLLMWGALSV